MNIFDKLFLKIGKNFFDDDETTFEKSEPCEVINWYTPDKAGYYPLFYDLYKNSSHILVAGTTGSGKSVFINDFIYTLLAKCSPASARFILIDPKRVELVKYKDLPHTMGYSCENDDIIITLKLVIDLMEARYTKMQERGYVKTDETPIYVVIDELADLMTTCKKDVMPLLQRIAQLGRAANIRLLCATQAPNRQVIPANLTLNFNTRVALHCFSPIESRQIIGVNGAEELPQYGQMIIQTPGQLQRYTMPMCDDYKLRDRVNYWISQKPERVYE